MRTRSKTIQINRRRLRRKRHLRRHVNGSSERPRMSVYRSNAHIYVQVIDDDARTTLCAASTMEKDLRGTFGGNRGAAERIGQLIAERAREKGINRVVFDRNGFKYHGRLAALADAARGGGLEF